MDQVKGIGRAIFAATFLLIGCVLDVIYGISAISNSHFFTQHSHYVFGDLKTWGWVTLIIGMSKGSRACHCSGARTELVRHRRSLARGDRGPARSPGGAVLVARRVRSEPLDHPWPGPVRPDRTS